jgi:hypothetical protein
MKKLFILFAAVLMAFGYIEKASAYTFTLKGEIGPYPITMVLNGQKWDEGQWYGYYYYNKNPKNRFKIYVSKRTECPDDEYWGDGCSKFVWQEYTSSGVNSAEFRGIEVIRVRIDQEHPESGETYSHLTIEGTFINKSNGKRLEFYVYGVL